jgi:hypothetical protein
MQASVDTAPTRMRLTMRFSEAQLSRAEAKLSYPNHLVPPWCTGTVATRNSSNRLLDRAYRQLALYDVISS